MTRSMIAIALVVAATAAGAQERESRPDRSNLPHEVVREVIDLYNDPNTLRADGSLDIVVDQEVRGDIAVLHGPLTIAGHVRGKIVAINADVILKPGARIDDGITVVGGVVEGRNDAYVAGEIRVFREVLYFHRDGEQIVAEKGPSDGSGDDWWDRKSRRKRTHNTNRLTLVSAKTYNRVEGLPIYFGPYMRHEYGALALKLDLFAVVRTADNLKFDNTQPGSDNFGHNVRGEIRLGPLGFGGKSYDMIEGVETWQLTDPEVGLASFFLHSDFRDYYNRHGGGAFFALYAGKAADLTFSYSGERWASRSARDPWTIFRNSDGWRPNPQMENTLVHLAGAQLHIDTRNDKSDPSTGWFISADYERGLRADTLTLGGAQKLFDKNTRAYNRGFVDLRRYNRMAPNAQLNFRFVAGGWVGQDGLPLQRRLSVPGGAGTMPGFDFRRPAGALDLGTCNTVASPNLPANCDRIALGQVEYRGNLHVDLFGWNGGDDWGFDINNDPTWVVFADAGRGWLLSGAPDHQMTFKPSEVPPFTSFRTDGGIGLEFEGFGMYLAKSLSQANEKPNFFVRVRHRF